METKIAFPQMLNKYRLLRNLTMEQLAEEVGKTKSTISKWESGSRSPKIYEIEEIAKYFGIEPQTMMFGDSSKIQLIYDKLNSTRQNKVLEFAHRELEQQNNQDDKVVPLFKVIGTTEAAAARGLGYGFDFDDYDTYSVYTDEEPPAYDVATRVSGNSMLPDYEDGDMLYLIDSGISKYSGQLCVVSYNDQTYFKKVFTEPDGLRLVSLNSDYADIFIDYPPEDGSHLKIFSVVGSFKPIEN